MAITRLGGKCCVCGYSDYRALEIDHIRGGGTKATRGNPTKPQHDIIAGRNLDHYQILCSNCNSIKRYLNKEIINDNYMPPSANGLG